MSPVRANRRSGHQPTAPDRDCFWGCSLHGHRVPTACAVGCILSLLRSCAGFGQRCGTLNVSDSWVPNLESFLAIVMTVTVRQDFCNDNRKWCLDSRCPWRGMAAEAWNGSGHVSVDGCNRAAAKPAEECSPRHKPWVRAESITSPEGAKEHVAYIGKHPVAFDFFYPGSASFDQT